MRIKPQSPSSGAVVIFTRYFGGAKFKIEMLSKSENMTIKIRANEDWHQEPIFQNIIAGTSYVVKALMGNKNNISK